MALHEEYYYRGSVGATLIVAAFGMLVDDEGMSPHQVFELVEQIKRDTFPALMEMYNENKNGR